MITFVAQQVTESTAKQLLEKLTAIENLAKPPVPPATSDWDIPVYFLILIIAGAFGGFVGELDPKTRYSLHFPGRPAKDQPFQLGWVGGVLVGIAAALGIMLIGDTFGVLRGTATDGFHLMRLMALGIIAGFTGHSLLSGLAEKLSDIARKQVDEQFNEKQEKLLALNDAIANADRLLRQGQFEQAQIAYESLEKAFPEQRLRAQKGIANCLTYLGKRTNQIQYLREAHRVLERLDREFPDSPEVAYNWMWVKTLIDIWEHDNQQATKTFTAEQLKTALTRAISLDPEAKRWARFQPDLRPLFARDASIAALVGGLPQATTLYKYKPGDRRYHLPTCPQTNVGDGWTERTEPPFNTGPCEECMP
jgi:hypothetical protein